MQATASDMMGLGQPAALAQLTGSEPENVTAAGVAQGSATAIKGTMVNLTATGADGAILPSDAPIGKAYFVANFSGSTGLIYAPSGHYMNNSLNGSLSVATAKAAIFVQYKRGYWASVLTA